MICKKGSGMISAKSGSMSSLQKHLAINFTKALSSKHQHFSPSLCFPTGMAWYISIPTAESVH